jgi:F-type H+-transporting ATPase subunit a
MSAAENAGAHAPTAGEYIQHHLQHLQMDFSFQSAKQTSLVDFGLFNFDSLIYSVILGALGCFMLWRAARTATSGVPGRFQAAVEILSEMVDTQAKGVIHNPASRKLVAPLALTVFVWIFLMNAMDMWMLCRVCGIRRVLRWGFRITCALCRLLICRPPWGCRSVFC